MNSKYPTWLEIDLQAISNNCHSIIRDTCTPLMAIVKADAYGYGAVQVAQSALRGGATWLGVARFDEARQLRKAGITAPVLVMGMVTSQEVDEAVASGVTLTLHNLDSMALFAQRSKAVSSTIKAHLKIDTGMGRLGVLPGEVVDFARQAQVLGIKVDGIFSHLATAEEDDHPLNLLQISRFAEAIMMLKTAGLRPEWAHLANSAGAYYLPQSRFDLVRMGNVVLGLRIRIDKPLPDHYKPSLRWKAILASCRKLPAGWGVGYGQSYISSGQEWIGVVPVGYGDGLRRFPGNHVLVHGSKCPVIGKLCLDQLMVRLPGPMPTGEEVVIIGRQDNESIEVHDLAGLYGTSQVDVTTLINKRVPRVYYDDF